MRVGHFKKRGTPNIDRYKIAGNLSKDSNRFLPLAGILCPLRVHGGRKGAKRLLPVRTAIMSRRVDKMCHLAYNSPLIEMHPWIMI
jgi:hypothetical protein